MSSYPSSNESGNPFVDNVQHVPVPVIASFNKEGKIIPLYFSVEGIKLRVDNIKWENAGRMWGNHFKCEVTLGERVEEVDLYYFADSRKWTMKKKY